MLHLVKPEPPKPKRRKWQPAPPVLTPEEEKRFRQAMHNLRDAFGTWACLAAAMGASAASIKEMKSGKRGVSGDMIVRAMRASGLTLDELLGGPAPADRCRACGQLKRRAA